MTRARQIDLTVALRSEHGTTPASFTERRRPHNWRSGLPRLENGLAALRELRLGDGIDLFQAMSRADVTRFISPPPSTVEGFDRFIAWAHRERAAGTNVCLAILGPGTDTAVGLIQFRALEGGFRVAEWGVALAQELWGTGLFTSSARLALQFAFDELGVHRLEARAVVRNGRGNAALRKRGAVQEGVLRQAFFRSGEYMDQVLWSLLADDWRQAQLRAFPPYH